MKKKTHDLLKEIHFQTKEPTLEELHSASGPVWDTFKERYGTREAMNQAIVSPKGSPRRYITVWGWNWGPEGEMHQLAWNTFSYQDGKAVDEASSGEIESEETIKEEVQNQFEKLENIPGAEAEVKNAIPGPTALRIHAGLPGERGKFRQLNEFTYVPDQRVMKEAENQLIVEQADYY